MHGNAGVGDRRRRADVGRIGTRAKAVHRIDLIVIRRAVDQSGVGVQVRSRTGDDSELAWLPGLLVARSTL